MTRDEAIDTIKLLYPADSEHSGTAKKGMELLDQARKEIGVWWEGEATAVLIRYAQLCQEEENRLGIIEKKIIARENRNLRRLP